METGNKIIIAIILAVIIAFVPIFFAELDKASAGEGKFMLYRKSERKIGYEAPIYGNSVCVNSEGVWISKSDSMNCDFDNLGAVYFVPHENVDVLIKRGN